MKGRPQYYCNLVSRPHYLYRIYSADALLYVGVTVNPEGRMSKHRMRPWWPQVTEVKLQPGASREDALAAERQAIIAENPAYNIARPKEAR